MISMVDRMDLLQNTEEVVEVPMVVADTSTVVEACIHWHCLVENHPVDKVVLDMDTLSRKMDD